MLRILVLAIAVMAMIGAASPCHAEGSMGDGTSSENNMIARILEKRLEQFKKNLGSFDPVVQVLAVQGLTELADDPYFFTDPTKVDTSVQDEAIYLLLVQLGKVPADQLLQSPYVAADGLYKVRKVAIPKLVELKLEYDESGAWSVTLPERTYGAPEVKVPEKLIRIEDFYLQARLLQAMRDFIAESKSDQETLVKELLNILERTVMAKEVRVPPLLSELTVQAYGPTQILKNANLAGSTHTEIYADLERFAAESDSLGIAQSAASFLVSQATVAAHRRELIGRFYRVTLKESDPFISQVAIDGLAKIAAIADLTEDDTLILLDLNHVATPSEESKNAGIDLHFDTQFVARFQEPLPAPLPAQPDLKFESFLKSGNRVIQQKALEILLVLASRKQPEAIRTRLNALLGEIENSSDPALLAIVQQIETAMIAQILKEQSERAKAAAAKPAKPSEPSPPAPPATSAKPTTIVITPGTNGQIEVTINGALGTGQPATPTPATPTPATPTPATPTPATPTPATPTPATPTPATPTPATPTPATPTSATPTSATPTPAAPKQDGRATSNSTDTASYLATERTRNARDSRPRATDLPGVVTANRSRFPEASLRNSRVNYPEAGKRVDNTSGDNSFMRKFRSIEFSPPNQPGANRTTGAVRPPQSEE